MKKYLPHVCVLTAGILWGMIGLFNRYPIAGGFTPKTIVLVRNFGGFLLMTLLFLVMDRSIFRIKARHLPLFLGTGVVSVVLFTLCYFTCQQQTSLAVSAILLYTAPAFVMLMSAIFFREKITGRKLIALGFAFLGCVAVSGIFTGGLSVTASGFLFGIGSAFFYALYSIFARLALAHYQPLTVTYYTFVCAGIASLFVENPITAAALLTSSPAIPLLALGLIVISTVVPFVLYTKGLAGLESGKASILASVEPVAAAVAGILVFGEPLGIPVVLGLLSILLSVYILR